MTFVAVHGHPQHPGEREGIFVYIRRCWIWTDVTDCLRQTGPEVGRSAVVICPAAAPRALALCWRAGDGAGKRATLVIWPPPRAPGRADGPPDPDNSAAHRRGRPVLRVALFTSRESPPSLRLFI